MAALPLAVSSGAARTDRCTWVCTSIAVMLVTSTDTVAFPFWSLEG